MNYCVWIVSPDNYEHHQAFVELAQSISFAFAELGSSAPVVRDAAEWRGRIPIVFGANLLRLIGAPELPPGSIIFNLEQVGSVWFDDEYLELLSRYEVFDYSRRNLERLHRAGIKHARLLEVGYSPILTRVAPHVSPSIGVAFFGALSDRRIDILQAIGRHGVSVFAREGVYGTERDAVLAQAKIAANIHYHENSPFEIVRVSYLLANRLCVVTEGSEDDPDLIWLAGGLEVASAEKFAAACAELANDPARRQATARRGFEIISSRRQSDLLRACLSGG